MFSRSRPFKPGCHRTDLRPSIKGTERSGQEYVSPLLLLTGEEYGRMSFEELHGRICDALRGNRSLVALEVLFPDGTHTIIRGRKTE
jgi:hypothetical protein